VLGGLVVVTARRTKALVVVLIAVLLSVVAPPAPATAAGVNQYGAPEWLPLRNAAGGVS
jgi:hypothetical protein